ncbi:uncharacterized protein LOC121879926 [Homarus americanus]|uniref:uncharacterized protein LOC121879926 n=1 Tax=Homarus americanus TaxID=6706 RepID=UPI001C44A082|nr:uncharacterized protein LOC121879926 [Homarus americanus]
MLNFVSAVLLLTLVGVVSPQCITTNDTQSPPLHPDLGHILPFSLGLFKELYVPGSATGNFFFSPFSIWNALVLAYFGSAGRTREQLQRVLNLKNPADTLATYKAVDRLYAERQANSSDYVIDLANRIYVDVNLPLRDCVNHVLSEEVQLLNFSQVNEAANKINQFVSETTRSKITQVVTPLDLENAVMAVVNAAYFKGLWLTPFKTSLTSKDKFFTSPNQHTLVDMMNLNDYFKVGISSELGATVLELPYKGEAASMFVLLPDSAATDDNTTTPLDSMLTRLTPYTLRAALATLTNQEVVIKIPKFEMEKRIKKELKGALQRLGIRDIFSNSADMSIFDPSRQIILEETIHKAVIEVNEEGSEAAAATVGFFIKILPFRIICNRPFLFFIHDNHTHNILFMGVYRQPCYDNKTPSVLPVYCRSTLNSRMLNFVSAVLLLTLVGVVSPQCITTNDTQPPPLHPDLGHILPFSLGLFKELYVPGSATGNFFFSPFSIWNALVLAYFGSAGRTQEQLQRVLNLKNPADTLATYKAVDRLYAERQANNSDYVIDLANRMYVNVSFTLRDCVSQVLSEEVQFLNFYQNDEAANKINQFVSETTRSKITQVVTPQDLKNVVMALINAAYFKGLWLTPFKTSLTSKDKFFTSPNQHTLVDMMNLNDYFKAGISSELGARVLELPYKGEAASMFVLLPDSGATDDNTTTPLDAMLTYLNPYSLRAALATLRTQRVLIRIPKFKMEKGIKEELKEALQRLGIRDIFSDSADMSIFDPLRQLKVKETIHKAVIEVNEEGSEAAAATVGLIVPLSGPLRFICNRPFLFFIHDNHTNNILFMGVYRQP